MDDALAAFIECLRRAAPRDRPISALPSGLEATVRQRGFADDLPGLFVETAVKAGATVCGATVADWVDRVAALLVSGLVDGAPTRGAPRAVVLASATLPARLLAGGPLLEQRLAALGVAVSDSSDDGMLFTAAASVTGVAAAIAETGTIVWHAGPDAARGVTLITPMHIAVVGVEQIVPDLHDYFERLAAGALPAQLSLITGPSKTADIEGVLVTGVHGPGKVHIVLVR